MNLTLSDKDIQGQLSTLAKSNDAFASLFHEAISHDASKATAPGSISRQAVHTLYCGADRFKAHSSEKMASLALKTLHDYAFSGPTLSEILGLDIDAELANSIYYRVVHKLQTEALEDIRIDFEDGYGYRSDEDEDKDAVTAAKELAFAYKTNCLPPFSGIRIKSLSNECMQRALRTLDIFLSEYKKNSEHLPDNFVVTLPKITHRQQLSVLISVLEILEKKLNFDAIPIELVIESPHAIIDANGAIAIPGFLKAGKGRVRGLHFGSYDYLSSTNINSQDANHTHPNSDFARHIMKICTSGRDITLSDSITNILPIAAHKDSGESTSTTPTTNKNSSLSEQQFLENRNIIAEAWRVHYKNIRRSIKHGFYQGWDLHPNQLPIRYFATYQHFLSGLDETTTRLNNFIQDASKATRVGSTFDDAATGLALINFFLQGLSCGALNDKDLEKLNMSIDQLKSRSFLTIIHQQKKAF